MRRALCALTLAACVVAAPAVRAADAPPAVILPAPAALETAPPADATGKALESPSVLTVFNRPIVRFRATFLGIPPAERAATARERVLTLLDRGGPGEVTSQPIPRGAVVEIDRVYAFVLTPEDARLLPGESFDQFVAEVVRKLQHAIGETREVRDLRLMLRAALWAAAATAIYVLALWGLIRTLRAVGGRLVHLADEAAARLRVGGGAVLERSRMLRLVHLALRIGGWAIGLLLTYEWLSFVLRQFPWTRPWGEQLNAFLVGTAGDFLAAIAGAAPDLVVVVLIFVIARWVAGALGYLFDGIRYGRIQVGWLDADTARPTRRLTMIVVWLFAIAMAYPYIPGSDTDAFKGVSVLVGLMVSVGASGLVSQAASGLILMYTRTYRPGEYVRLGDREGTVVEMGMFTTRVRTGLGEELTLPNALVLGSVTTNYSRTVKGVGFVLDTTATIGFDTPWRQVHAMLEEAARRTEGVIDDPPPRVFQTALSDFYVEYRLVCQAVPHEPLPRAQVLSTLHQNVQDVFNERGVQIMSPHYLGDPVQPKVVPKSNWYAPPAAPPA